MSDGLISAAEGIERLQRSGWTADPSAASAKVAALAALSALPEPEPVASVSYVSRGSLLVIAPSEAAGSALATAEALRNDLDVHVLYPSALAAVQGFLAWEGKAQSLKGYLGAFEATWRANAAELIPPAPRAGQSAETVVLASAGEAPVVQFDAAQKLYTGFFDLILDFSIPAHFRMPQPPQGYFAVGRDAAALEAACTELVEMVGEFEKPKFFAYKEKICAHSRSQKSGCNLCIEVCSTSAISSDGDHVKVDAHLCMGCGGCATVCPSGAMAYQYPRVADRGAQVKALLAGYRAAGGGEACILLHNGSDGRELLAQAAQHGTGLPGHVLPIETWHIASTGIDLLLGAVCYGAANVALLSTGSEAPEYSRALTDQMGFAQAILNALGYAGTHFALIEAATPGQLDAALARITPADVPGKLATFNLANDKRTSLEFAIEHLARNAPQPQQEIALSKGAPFGRVNVDAAKCTLCMACTGACPESALMDSPDTPRLKFVERNCVQCGLCRNTCPENAITLTPRLLLTPQWKQEVVLHEAEPFHCISCGKPLGTRQMIDSMLGKLAAHPMFAGEGKLKRLQMCADCRVVDMMSNPNEMSILTGSKLP
jgi:ferredoxin